VVDARVSSLQEQLTIFQGKAASAEALANELQEKLQLTERALGYAEEARDAAQAQVTTGAEQAAQRIAALEATVAELQAALSEASENEDTLEVHAVRLQASEAASTVSDLMAEVAQLKKDLAIALEKVSEAQAAEAATASASMAVHAEISELRKELLQSRDAIIKAQDAKSGSLKGQNINAEMNKFLQNAQSLHTEMLELRGSLEQASMNSNVAAGTTLAMEDLRKEFSIAETEASEKRAKLELEVKGLKSQLEKARAEVAAAIEEPPPAPQEVPLAQPRRKQPNDQRPMQGGKRPRQYQEKVDDETDDDFYENGKKLAQSRSSDDQPRWLKALRSGRALRMAMMAPLVAYFTMSGGNI